MGFEKRRVLHHGYTNSEENVLGQNQSTPNREDVIVWCAEANVRSLVEWKDLELTEIGYASRRISSLTERSTMPSDTRHTFLGGEDPVS